MSFLFFYKIKNFVWPGFSGQLTWHVTRYLCRIDSRKIRWQPKINGKIEKKKNQINIKIQKKRNKFEKKIKIRDGSKDDIENKLKFDKKIKNQNLK